MSYDVFVTGRSIPALQAALECAELGLRVGVAEDAYDLEPPRAPIADAEGTVRAFLQRIASPIAGSAAPECAGALPIVSAPAARVARDTAGQWAPLAEPSVLGIPATPLDAAVIRLIGTKAAFRAYTDRIRPVLTVGKTQHLAPLVQQRMGASVLNQLVEPEIFDRFGVPASVVDVAVAAPGLNEALTRQGSLSTAVLAYAERHAEREHRVAPAGGGAALKAEMLRKLELFTGEVVAASVAQAVRVEDGWLLTLSDGREVPSRSLVLDAGRSAEHPTLVAQLAPEVALQRTRMIARAAVLPPPGVPVGSEAILRSGQFSISVLVESADAAVAVISGSVNPGELPAAPDTAELERALTEAQLVLAAEATWSTGVAAAPFATIEQRDAAVHATNKVSERDPMLLVLGRSLCGDDLGLALRTAESGTVQLRRRLLGLID